MKRNIFSSIFFKRLSSGLLFIFGILSFFSINHANAGICVKGKDAGAFAFIRMINSCADNSEINSSNYKLDTNIQLVKTERDLRKSEATDFATELNNNLDKEIEDSFKDSYDVKYVKNIINQSVNVAEFQFDSLITGALTYQRLFFLHDQLGRVAIVTQKTYISTTFKEFLDYLNTKENSTSTSIKNSVSPKLKSFLEESIALSSSYFKFSDWFTQNNINQVKFTDVNEGTNVTIAIQSNIESINNTDLTNIASNEYPFHFVITKLNLDPTIDPSAIKDPPPTNPAQPTNMTPGGYCAAGVGISDWFNPLSSKDLTGCSFIALVVNSTLTGLIQLFGYVLSLSGSIFDWSMNFSIIHFNDWVINSEAYTIWRDVVLALITSLLLPIVFYLIIRMLIDNDADKIKKLLPRILVTALFVYFSFYIAGWLIDRANELSIYMYRSLHGSEAFGSSIKSVLGVDTTSLGSAAATWDSTLYLIVKVIVVGSGIFVIFQGAILIFVRSITLILALIFSPLMLLPIGINDYIDKYREMVIKHFTNATIMAPIFMIMLLVAMKIGAAASGFIENSTALNSIKITNAPAGVPANFIGASVASIFVIIVLQLAITIAKQMSGELGQKISGKISSLAGSMAFGGAAKGLRTFTKGAINNEKFQGWMKKNEGTTRGKVMSNLVNRAQNSTMDVRNTKGFDKLAGGINGEKNAFGAGTQSTIRSKFEKDYANARKYHNSLTEEGQKRNLERLRGTFGGANGKEIANRLEGKNSGLSIRERITNEKVFNDKLDKANKEKNVDKRREELLKTLDEHFADNGKGDKYLSKELEKPENKELKEKIEKINKDEKDEAKRKEEILKATAEFEEKKNKEEQLKQNKNSTENNTNSNRTNNQTSENSNNTRDVSSIRNSLAQKYGSTENYQKSLKEKERAFVASQKKELEESEKLIDKSIARQAKKILAANQKLEDAEKKELSKTFSSALAKSNSSLKNYARENLDPSKATNPAELQRIYDKQQKINTATKPTSKKNTDSTNQNQTPVININPKNNQSAA